MEMIKILIYICSLEGTYKTTKAPDARMNQIQAALNTNFYHLTLGRPITFTNACRVSLMAQVLACSQNIRESEDDIARACDEYLEVRVKVRVRVIWLR